MNKEKMGSNFTQLSIPKAYHMSFSGQIVQLFEEGCQKGIEISRFIGAGNENKRKEVLGLAPFRRRKVQNCSYHGPICLLTFVERLHSTRRETQENVIFDSIDTTEFFNNRLEEGAGKKSQYSVSSPSKASRTSRW